MRTVLMLGLCLVLAACANPYEQFYQPNLDMAANAPHLIPFKGEPELIQGTTPEVDMDRMAQEGYSSLGASSFNAGQVSQESVIAQAKKIGAARVILYKKFTNSVSGSMPLTLPDTQTTYHSGTVSGYGSGYRGYGSSYSGSYGGTSTTYGTKTTYIPYTINKYDYGATYWAKRKRGGLGVTIVGLTPEQKSAIGSNKGVAIRGIVRGSAAYEANIVPGDILRRIDNVEIEDMQSAVSLIRQRFGQTVNLVLWRNGREIQKKVFIPSYNQ